MYYLNMELFFEKKRMYSISKLSSVSPVEIATKQNCKQKKNCLRRIKPHRH